MQVQLWFGLVLQRHLDGRHVMEQCFNEAIILLYFLFSVIDMEGMEPPPSLCLISGEEYRWALAQDLSDGVITA
jgi:hypothetical protein